METKIAVVVGGTGGVGEGIVKSLLKKEFTVVVPTRSEHKIQSLKEYTSDIETGKLIPIVGSVNNIESAEKLRKYLSGEFKSIDLVVASLGGWHQGYPITSYPLEDWNKILDNNLTSHFLAIKTLVPLLNPQKGFYFHINGFSAEGGYPMAGPVAMTAAAQKSLIQTLGKELAKTGIQVHELILGPMKTRDRLKHGHGQDDWYYPEEIGNYIINIVSKERQEKEVHYLLSKEKEN
jgi:NAD(P)-dependent dehydrogenase (short-subunit alcohol dehydrogenase family)